MITSYERLDDLIMKDNDAYCRYCYKIDLALSNMINRLGLSLQDILKLVKQYGSPTH